MITFDNKEYTEEDFLAAYMQAKTFENDAKERRIKMEEALLERYGDNVDENKTSKAFKEGRFSISIKRNISYKLSEKGWELVWAMPEAERPVDVKYNHTKGKNLPAIALEEIPNETKPTFTVQYI